MLLTNYEFFGKQWRNRLVDMSFRERLNCECLAQYLKDIYVSQQHKWFGNQTFPYEFDYNERINNYFYYFWKGIRL